MTKRYDQLAQLKKLYDDGVITEDEFHRERNKVLNDDTPETSHDGPRPWGMETNVFCLLIHLSQFANFVVPLAGFILPIVMWITEKDRSPAVDKQGKVVVNWVITSFIYICISIPLAFVGIGIVMLMALAICSFIFTIIGAVKANQGIVWPYPMSIPFF